MKNFIVYFGTRVIEDMEVLQEFSRFKEGETFVLKHIRETQKPCHYIRTWQDGNIKWFDFGSHTRFYAIVATIKQ